MPVHLLRPGLIFEAHTLLHNSTLVLREIEQSRKKHTCSGHTISGDVPEGTAQEL
jgi:hypothetical protein